MSRRVLASLVVIFSLGSISRISKTDFPSDGPISLRDFAQLTTSLSEPEGYFDSDNFVSNERAYLKVLPDLKRHGVRGGVYLGVGPDQNFSYIAFVKPRLAIIIDIRRQNLLQHLYFKSIFQLSPNRARYLERLFGKSIADLPEVPEACSISELLHFIDRASPDHAFAAQKLAEAIRLMQSWNLGLRNEDFEAVRFIAQTFMAQGPDMKFSSYNRPARAQYPSYRQLLEETDLDGIQSNYLAHEENFRFVRNLQRENRIVPIVGDLAGPSALARTAEELRRRNLSLTCFYVSNVEFYLFASERWPAYLRNVRRLPHATNAYLIRSYANRGMLPSMPGYYMGTMVQSLDAFLADESAGINKSYWDLIRAGQH